LAQEQSRLTPIAEAFPKFTGKGRSGKRFHRSGSQGAMAEVISTGTSFQEAEGLIEQEEAQPPRHFGRSLRLGAFLAFGSAALAVATVVARGGHQSAGASSVQPDAQAMPQEASEPSSVDSVVQLFQPDRLSCPSCTCDCAWARAANVCDREANDGHCCWSCCCNGGYSNPHFGSALDSSFNIYHNYDRLPCAHGDKYHGSVHVDHHTVVHYHYYHHYNVGDMAFVKGQDGKWEAVQITRDLGNGQYEVKYAAGAQKDGGATSQVEVYHMQQQDPTVVSPWVWAFILFVLAIAGIYAYIYAPK